MVHGRKEFSVTTRGLPHLGLAPPLTCSTILLQLTPAMFHTLLLAANAGHVPHVLPVWEPLGAEGDLVIRERRHPHHTSAAAIASSTSLGRPRLPEPRAALGGRAPELPLSALGAASFCSGPAFPCCPEALRDWGVALKCGRGPTGLLAEEDSRSKPTAIGDCAQKGSLKFYTGHAVPGGERRKVTRRTQKKLTSRHIIIKLANTNDKARILKAPIERQKVIYKGSPIRLLTDFSIETQQARREWNEIYKVIQRKGLNPRILYLARLSIKVEGEIRSFTDKTKKKKTKKKLRSLLPPNQQCKKC
ncbi:hypothetical protein QTO34_017060 [Cnephaeus nilssonii]|uniref:Uncharacterized protein n=1 Tax=Cnephaeus nilssonii TaxID=3371016 RepID=A0AA40I162_CNENI|nr:hypothetical protein QTO34_017060 [Eptesicus nilssonii]